MSGELFVREGLITRAQLEEALQIQKTRQTYAPIGQVLLEQKLITPQQLNSILDRYGKRARLGRILLAAKVITEDQLNSALVYQRKTNLRLGDALHQLDFVTENEIKQAVSTQQNVPIVQLENFAPDPGLGLAQLIKKEYAEKHRVIPIAKDGDTLTAAMDDPTDVAVVEELQALTGCTLNVVTCTRKGFLRALVRVYGADARGPTRATSSSRDDTLWRG